MLNLTSYVFYRLVPRAARRFFFYFFCVEIIRKYKSNRRFFYCRYVKLFFWYSRKVYGDARGWKAKRLRYNISNNRNVES